MVYSITSKLKPFQLRDYDLLTSRMNTVFEKKRGAEGKIFDVNNSLY